VAAYARIAGRAASLAEQHRWLSSVVRGHYGYYGMPHNYPALSAFHQEVRRLWFRTLRRRSQKAQRLNWDAFKAIVRASLRPCRASLTHGRAHRHDAGYSREEPDAGKPHVRICEGKPNG
jgi:hypothetical protein